MLVIIIPERGCECEAVSRVSTSAPSQVASTMHTYRDALDIGVIVGMCWYRNQACKAEKRGKRRETHIEDVLGPVEGERPKAIQG